MSRKAGYPEPDDETKQLSKEVFTAFSRVAAAIPKELQLEKLRIKLMVSTAPLLLEPHIEFKERFGQIAAILHGHIWATSSTVYTFRWPRNWWQALKERWFPNWAKKHWPPIFEQHQLDVRLAFPDFRPYVDQLGEGVWKVKETRESGPLNKLEEND